jgi:hypothetical protein
MSEAVPTPAAATEASPTIAPETSAPKTEAAKPSSSETFKIKVNGKEQEVTLDKLLVMAQKGTAADERFNEAAKLRKEAEEIVSTAKSEKSALKTLMKAGYSKEEARQIVEDELRKEYEWEDLPEDEKKRRQMEDELERYRRTEKERQEAEERSKLEKEDQEYATKLEQEMVGALESSWLPRNEIYGKAAFNYMAAAARKGFDLSASDAVKLVESDFVETNRAAIKSMDLEQALKIFGEEKFKEYSGRSVSEVKQKEAPFTKPAQAVKQAKSESPDKESKPTVIRGRDFWDKKRGF